MEDYYNKTYMNIIQNLIIPYECPSELSDAYSLYSDKQKVKILNANSILNINDLNIIFRPRPIGAYQESVYFLPQILIFIFQNYWKYASEKSELFEKLLRDFFLWILMYYDLLKADNLWKDLDEIIYILFCKLTSKYKLNSASMPIGHEYVSCFFDKFNKIYDDDPCVFNFPKRNVDVYIKKHFTKFEEYDKCAWFVYIYIGYLRSNWGLSCAYHSDILGEFQKNKIWHHNVLEVIIRKTEEKPNLIQYWSNLLDQGMIF